MRLSRILLFSAILAVWAFTAIRAVSLFNLSPDSANYINASQNWLRSGRLFVYANFPSWSMEPEIEQYTEQPPGMPYLLAPLLLVIREPSTAAAVLQVLAILFLFGGVFAVGRDMGFGLLAQFCSAAAFALFSPLVFVYRNFWSEVPFIALTIWSLHFLARAYQTHKNLDWLAALILAAGATAVRSIGILTLPVFLFAAYRRPAPARRLPEASRGRLLRWLYVLLSFAFVLGPLAAWSVRNRALYGAASATHVLQVRSDLGPVWRAFAFLRGLLPANDFLAVAVLVFGLAWIGALFLGADLSSLLGKRFQVRRMPVRAGGALLSLAGLGVLAYALGTSLDLAAASLGVRLRQLAAAGLGAALLLSPWIRYTNLRELFQHWKAQLDRAWFTSPRFYMAALVLLAGISQFAGILVLSVITPFDPLEHRLLAPSLSLLLLACLIGLRHLTLLYPAAGYRLVILALALLAGAVSPFMVKQNLEFTPGFIYPSEKQAWQELERYPGISRVSHFYSDDDFAHEIYANCPQRVITWVDWSSAEFLRGLLVKGTCPFLLVSRWSGMASQLDQIYPSLDLQREELLNGDYILYAGECLFQP